MRIICRSWVMFLMITLSVLDVVSGEEILPDWEPGYQWSIQTYLDINMKDPDSSDQIDMIIEDDSPPYICQGIESRKLTRGDMLEYDVYRLTFSGAVSGEGTADVSILDTEIPVELRSGTEVGEMWVDINTLGTVFSSRFITGDLWAYYLFSWHQVGTIEIAFTEEYQPSRDCIRFPVEVGNQWSDNLSLFFYGRYLVNYDFGSGPQTQEDTFDDTITFDLAYDVTAQEMYKTWSVYHIEGTDAEWNGMLLARYAGIARNYAYLSMTDLDMPDQGILIRELRMDLIDFDLTPFPTPTPTPTPDPSTSGTTLHLSADMYEKGETFRLSRTLVNAGSSAIIDEYIILDVYEAYWFWPDWTQSVSSQRRSLDAMSVYPDEVVITFVWPDVSGSASNLRFWGAMLESTTQTLFGNYDTVTWGYH